MISLKKEDNNYKDLENFSTSDAKRSNRKKSKRKIVKAPNQKFFYRAREILTNKEIVTRISVTIGIIAIYRLLSAIPLPGINMRVFQDYFDSGTVSEANLLFATFTGGQLESPSIVGLGIAAYINASIIMQLLTPVIPKLNELSKEGERGRQTINQYTRFLTLPFSIMYSIAYVVLMARRDLNLNADGTSAGDPVYLVDSAVGSDWPTLTKIVFMTVILTAGSMFIMWLAELITEKGIGNGSSIMITIGILSALPSFLTSDFRFINFSTFFADLLSGNFVDVYNSRVLLLLGVILGFVLVIGLVVFVSESQRKIQIQYARRMVEGNETNLPIKLTVTGVLPMIFASSLLAVPQLIIPLSNNLSGQDNFLGNIASSMENSFLLAANDSAVTLGDFYYSLLYFVLIVIFGVFYAFIVIKPEDTAENLQKSGAFIPGIRPGKATENYIAYVLSRIGFAGAIFLGLIALIPMVARLVIINQTGINLLILSGIGGTSILIVVSVVLDTVRQFNSYRVSRSYSQFAR